MLKSVIEFSLKNKFLVLAATVALVFGGVYSLRQMPLDAIPDLSDTQVIVYTEWAGQAPQIVQDQVTFPITSKMLSVPGATVVRGYSFFGYSFVYVIFRDGTDPYWARSRVLEYLNGLQGELPKEVRPGLGPDATGVGWAFMYSLNSPRHDLAELRSMQDWFLRYQLASVEGVAEVASVGGFVKQYQVTVDPLRLRAYNLSIGEVAMAVERSNGEVGGRSLELAEREFILRVKGYVRGVEDLGKVAVGSGPGGTPVLLGEVARVEVVPDMRRGIAEWDGEGETVGGIVVVRQGVDTRRVISAVRAKLEAALKSLPEDVTCSLAYDRTGLIEESVRTLESKLVEEMLVVVVVCALFLLHLRSALVAVVFLPVAVLASVAIMHGQGLSANIMSLGGIAIAIGAMVDAAIIMIENAHKHMERDGGRKPHWDIIRDAAVEVGPTLFCSLLVITVSFLPVFALQAQEGRMFKPLAYTKTYAMGAAALLSLTLAPVLMGLFIRGKIPPETRNPLNRLLIWLYHPVLNLVLKYRWLVVATAAAIVAWVFFPWNAAVERLLPDGPTKEHALKLSPAFPWQNIGSEFMPPLYEGDLLYMPTTLPGISPTKARELLQQTDRIIKSFPEVRHVLGKIGRAETATDPAPMDMIETTIMLKPTNEWPAVAITDATGKTIAHRPRTIDELTAAMNAAVQIPGLTNAWTMPIKTRIDMLATGIKTPVGIKVAGPDLRQLEHIATALEPHLRPLPGTTSVFAERVMGGNYIEIDINRDAIARHGLTLRDVQDTLQAALGGMPLTTTIEGLERYGVTLRYERDYRDNLEALAEILIPIKTPADPMGTTPPMPAQIPLSQLATTRIVSAPMGIKSEAATPNAWIYIDVDPRTDIGTYVRTARHAVETALATGQIHLPPGYTLHWSGQYEYMQRATARLQIVIPLTLLLITLILYLNTRSWAKTAIVLLAIPFSLVGAIWALHLGDYNMSVAVWVGLIALAGLDAETGVIMLLYLDLAHDEWKNTGRLRNKAALREAIYHGAVKRVRPKAMTAAVIIAGLLPILWSHGAGADTMKRIALPMVGGVLTSTLMELLVYPAIFYLWRGKKLQNDSTPTARPRANPSRPTHAATKTVMPFAATLAGALLFIAGCAPTATQEENDARERANRIGQILATTPNLPALREDSPPEDFLRFALLKHPAVRAAYHDWLATIEDITPARSLPDPKFTFETDISSTLMSLMPGVMFDFMLPGKLRAMGREATAASEVAYRNYAATVLSTSAEVRQAWIELAYVEANTRLLDDTHDALEQALDLAGTDYATARNMAGLDATMLAMNNTAQLRTQIAVNEERRVAARARFKSALGLLPEENTPPWPCIPLNATVLPDENTLWERARTANPEIATMRAMAGMALAGVDVAHQTGTPDFSLGLMADLKASPIMFRPAAGVTLPVWREKITAIIAAARARSQSASARLDTAQINTAAEFAQMLFMVRETDRMIAYIDSTALPYIDRAQAAVAVGYQTGMAPPAMLHELHLMRVKMQTERLNALRQRETAVTRLLFMAGISTPRDAPLAEARTHEEKSGQ